MNPLVPAPYDVFWSTAWLAVAAYSVIAFVSLVRSPDVTGMRFLLWTVFVVALPMVGATAWFALGRRPVASQRQRGRTSPDR